MLNGASLFAEVDAPWRSTSAPLLLLLGDLQWRPALLPLWDLCTAHTHFRLDRQTKTLLSDVLSSQIVKLLSEYVERDLSVACFTFFFSCSWPRMYRLERQPTIEAENNCTRIKREG